MSFSTNGVKFTHRPKTANLFFGFFVKITEAVLSVLFIISLAAPLGFPNQVNATLGVSTKLSYQGRLTDSNGNSLTGTYCMRFSLWDVSSGGTRNPNQLWPSSYATPTSNSVVVTNGVFNVGVGEVDDLSSYDFSANNTQYLYVEVNNVVTTCSGSWEALTPNQRTDATAYARVAENVYGGNVRIGTGAGSVSPKLLYLDVKNTTDYIGDTCSTNGTVWFNSASSRGLICESGHLKAISNATSTLDSLSISGNTAGSPSLISSGSVTLAGGNNITLSQAGNAITISAGAGGGGAGISAGTQSVSTGTVNFANSNNVSFGMSGSNQITASIPSIHNVSLGGNSTSAGAGYIQISSGTMQLAGGNNVTLSQNGASVTISAFNQTVQTQNLHNLTLGGNSTSAGAGYIQVSSGTLTLAGGNNITLSQNGNAITIVGGAGGGGAALQGSGTYSQNTGTVQFANSNGVTFGLSNNGVMTASVAAGGGGVAVGDGASNVTNNTVVFSNANGVSFGLNGSTMTASVAAGGGGGGFALQDFANLSYRAFITNVTNMTAVSQRPIFTPFVLPGSLTWNWGNLEVSRATSGSNLFTAQIGIYSFVNSTQISLMGSLQNTYSNTATASISGVRRMQFTGMGAGATALNPGHYVMGMMFSAAATASMNYSLRGGQTVGPPVGNFAPGANANTTATSQLSSLPMGVFLGRYTTTSGAMPGSVAFSQVQHYSSNAPIYFYLRST